MKETIISGLCLAFIIWIFRNLGKILYSKFPKVQKTIDNLQTQPKTAQELLEDELLKFIYDYLKSNPTKKHINFSLIPIDIHWQEKKALFKALEAKKYILFTDLKRNDNSPTHMALNIVITEAGKKY